MNIIKIDGEIGYWGANAQEIKRLLNEMSGDVTVEINSPGGSVFEGVSIFNALKAYEKGDITTVITGLAASMASYVALAGKTIKAYDNATYMIHNAWMFTYGDFNKLRKDSNTLEALSAILKKAYVSRTGKADKEIQSAMDAESYYFGSEILDMGFVHEIISTENESDKSQAISFASESFKACMQNVQIKTNNTDLDQAAAILATMPSDKEKIANQPKGVSMEFNKEAFEALKAEHAKALKDGIGAAATAERERVEGILALAGDQELKAKAIKDGSSIGECAIALNQHISTEMQKQKESFESGADALAQNNTEQSTVTDPAKLALAEDDEAYYAKKQQGVK